jgi:transcription initiation factor TFIID subunit TAF12
MKLHSRNYGNSLSGFHRDPNHAQHLVSDEGGLAHHGRASLPAPNHRLMQMSSNSAFAVGMQHSSNLPPMRNDHGDLLSPVNFNTYDKSQDGGSRNPLSALGLKE